MYRCGHPLEGSFRSNMLQRLWTVHEIVGIGFWHKFPLVWLLHKVLVSLFLGEENGVLFAFEVDMRSLHEIGG